MRGLELDLSNPEVNPTAKVSSINQIFSIILNFLTGAAAVIFLFFMIYGGYLWITSAGEPEKISKAKKNFTYSILGLVLVLTSLLITKLLGYVFKLQFKF